MRMGRRVKIIGMLMMARGAEAVTARMADQ
jgi:hypothetical protein